MPIALHPFFMSHYEDIMRAKEVAPFELHDQPRTRKWIIIFGPSHDLDLDKRATARL